MDITFTDREADVMQVLWEHGPSSVAEVQARIGAELAYTTILTVLRTLETKGHVGHQEQGRSYRYHAIVGQQVARKSALRHLTSKLFKGSAELLMTQLVCDQKLTAEELRRMRALLAEHDDKEQP
jgi:predicted transcriptional regulator